MAYNRVLVCLPTSWDWVEGWLGALMLGALPAAVAPAGAMGSSEGHGSKIERLLERTGARRILAGEVMRDDLRRAGAERAAEATLTPEELRDATADAGFRSPAGSPDEIAFLHVVK